MHTMLGVTPNQPKTPIRSVRVPDEKWFPGMAYASDDGETISDVIRRAIDDHIAKHEAKDQRK